MQRTAPRTKARAPYTVEEVAALLRVPVRVVERHCEAAAADPGVSFFSGVWKDGNAWMIPAGTLARALDTRVQPHYRMRDVCALYGLSYRLIRARVHVVPAGVPLSAAPRHSVAARKVCGEIRIPESELLRLEAGEVTATPALS